MEAIVELLLMEEGGSKGRHSQHSIQVPRTGLIFVLGPKAQEDYHSGSMGWGEGAEDGRF